ncbi:uncharacterized protein TNIN_182151 [Trichonephila inaurata madagascariensis]|uniref:Uncharacterized protein n=1 Tax=Trichonephila inaurata madagascariensis TaxID=2747483 RepID=A0A8X6YDM3_9ARAC|nr:uncharacterized protein TNIN_182151 [Trichonephila inaurata madagascariensis]
MNDKHSVSHAHSYWITERNSIDGQSVCQHDLFSSNLGNDIFKFILEKNSETMHFSREERKEVFSFFNDILSTYSEPVYYENLRGHVSRASDVIRQYVLKRCKGDNFLEYFLHRKNYFIVEQGYVILKKNFNLISNKNSSCSPKNKCKGKIFKRSSSLTSNQSFSSALSRKSSIVDGKREYENIAINYFKNRLIRKKKERLSSLERGELPKKVKRHIQNYYKNKVNAFLSDFPDKFNIDENEIVSLVTRTLLETYPGTTKNERGSVIIDSEILEALHYLECITYFAKVLKTLPQPFPIEKLGGCFSQASKEVKEHIKCNYRNFKCFFDDPTLIFQKNKSERVSLSKDYERLMKKAEKIIRDAEKELQKNDHSKPVITLKSRINFILQPQITPLYSPTCFEQRQTSINTISSNEEVLSHDEMLDVREVFDEILKSKNHIKAETKKLTEILSDKLLNGKEIPCLCDTNISNADIQKSGHVEDILLRCIFTVELYCLEFIEKEIEYIEKYEPEAVKYFMEILDSQSTRIWTLTSLHGTLGHNREIAHFMKKVYKGEKFCSFFQKYRQFSIKNTYISLTSRNETDCPGSFNSLSLHSKTKNKSSLNDTYESSDFKELIRKQNFNINQMSNSINLSNNSTSCLSECLKESIDIIKNAIANDEEIHYFEVLKMIPVSVLQAITDTKNDSRFIINTLQESGQFVLKSGMIGIYCKSVDLENYNVENISVPTDTINKDKVKIANGSGISKELFSQQNVMNGIDSVDGSFPQCSITKTASSDKCVEELQCEFEQFSEILQTGMDYENHVGENENFITIEKDKETTSENTIKYNLNDIPDTLHMQPASENSAHSEHSYSEKVTESDLSIEDEKTNLNHLSTYNSVENILGDNLSGVIKEDVRANKESINLDFAKKNLNIDEILMNDKNFNLDKESEDLTVCGKQSNVIYKFKSDLLHSFSDLNEENDEEIINISNEYVIPNDIECVEKSPVSPTSENFLPNKHETYSNQDLCFSPICEDMKFNKSEVQLNESEIVGTAMNAEDSDESVAKIIEMPIDLNVSYDEKGKDISVSIMPVNLFSELTTIKSEDMCEEYVKYNEIQNNISLQSTNSDLFKDSKNKFSTVFNNTYKTSKISKEKYFQVNVPEILDFDIADNQSQFEGSLTTATDISTSENCNADQVLNAANANVILDTKKSHICASEKFSVTSSYSNDLNIEIPTEKNGEVDQHFETLQELLSKTETYKSSTKLPDSFKILKNSTICKLNDNEESISYPMQPIAAKIIILSNESCIAVSEINQRTQSIYFRKCVFQCDHQDDCSDCFNSLKIGDKISCFVPLVEISHKIWIAFLVSKDSTENFVEFDVNKSLQYDGKMFSYPSNNFKSVSIQTENSTSELGCQTEFLSNYLIPYKDSTKSFKTTKTVKCQVNAIPVTNVFTQTENETKTCDTQTEISDIETSFHKKIAVCQTDISGNIKKYAETEDILCQTDLSGSVIKVMKNFHTGCQTFSTGPIMMLAHHPM